MKASVRWSVLLSAAWCMSAAWGGEGQEACERALADREVHDPVVELTSDDLIIKKVRFQKDYSSRFASHGPFIEKETRINSGGREMEFLNEYACTDDGELVITREVALDETLPTIEWRKGLPLLVYPIYEGQTWSWEGTHVDIIYGSESKAAATASGYVVGFETILDGSGKSLSTVHVRLDVKWGKGSAKVHQIIDSWYAQAPLRLVKRTTQDVSAGRTLRLDPSTDSTVPAKQVTTQPVEKKKEPEKQIIILKQKIE